MNNKKIIVFTGPTGVGKSTVMNYLKENFNVISPLCFTTRKKREKEDLFKLFEKVYNKLTFFIFSFCLKLKTFL